MKRIFSLTTLAILCCSCASCFWVPTRRFVPGQYQSRRLVTDETLQSIEVGGSSRESVLLNLGEPDSLTQDERYYLYRWMSVQGWGFWTIGGYYQAVGDGGYTGERTDYLLIEFDEQGIVSWFGEVRSWPDRRPVASLALHLPYTLSVGYWSDGEYRTGQLTLNERSISFEDPRHPDDAFTLDSERITGFNRPGVFSKSRYETPIGEITGAVADRDVVYTLRFDEETPHGDALSIAVDVFRFPTLVDYVFRYCRNAVYDPEG